MPGKVVNILVKIGDVVNAGETIIILDAMKMENILRADRKAKVKKVNVKAGDSLAVDDIIMEFE